MSLQNKTFNELVTFTRATGGGRFNAAGQYEWLSADQPRFDYDPVTLEPRGILIEEQRTNLLRGSEEFQTTWANERSSEQVDVIISPAGTLTGCKLVEDTTSTNTHLILQGVPGLSSGSRLTFSAYIKAAERTSARLQINDGSSLENDVFAAYDVSTGTVSSVRNSGKFTGASATITPVGNGWYRCSISGVATGATAVQVRIFLINGVTTTYTGDGTSGIYIWGAQLEAGAFPTSYIPTTTAQVTRAADLCSVDTLSLWYRADEGTLMVDWNLPVNTSDNNQLAAFGSAVASSMAIRMGVNNGRRVRAFAQDASGVFQYSVDCPVEASRTTGKSAFAYKLKDDFAASSAGSLNKDVSGDISNLSVDALRVGNNSGSYTNGHIRRIRYTPRRISDHELQALTTF